MKLRKFASAAVIIASSALLTVYALTQSSLPAGRTPLGGSRSLGAPTTFKNLTVIPVYDSSAKPFGAYVTLDEGLKSKVVKVQESKNGGDVNTLYITNSSSKPVYVMAGEVVLGGQQDRCLGKDLIIAPGKKRIPISVFCVEHGRWSGRSDFAGSAKMVASAGIRSDAQDGAFVPAAPLASEAQSGRGRVARATLPGAQLALTEGASIRVNSAQSKVWDKVAKKNASFKAETSTGTYQHVLNMSGGDAQKSIAPYVKALSNAAGKDPHLVGAVAAVNGKVIAADIFGDPVLFRKLWPKLLNSYAADAAENAPAATKGKVSVSQKEAKEFLADAHRKGSKAESRSDAGVAERYETKTAVTFSLKHRGDGSGGGGLGGAVHENVLAKEK